MAGIQLSDKGSKKRSLNCDLNLVPFIDLLSVSIRFLLMTAVWIQLGAISVAQEHGTEADESSTEIELVWNGPTSLQFLSTLPGRRKNQSLLEGTSTEAVLKKLQGQISATLQGKDPKSVIAKVTTHAALSYSGLVDILDILREFHVTRIGIIPPSGVAS